MFSRELRRSTAKPNQFSAQKKLRGAIEEPQKTISNRKLSALWEREHSKTKPIFSSEEAARSNRGATKDNFKFIRSSAGAQQNQSNFQLEGATRSKECSKNDFGSNENIL